MTTLNLTPAEALRGREDAPQSGFLNSSRHIPLCGLGVFDSFRPKGDDVSCNKVGLDVTTSANFNTSLEGCNKVAL